MTALVRSELLKLYWTRATWFFVAAALLPPATVVLVGLILALLAVLGVYVFAVVDAFLPDGNGVELVRELRRADPGLSIMILTAGVDPKLHALAFEAGADEVCLKAEGIEEIMKAIRGVAADR